MQFPSAVAHYGSINNITYYDEVVKNNDSEEKKNTAIKRKVLPKFGTDYTNAEARQVLRAFDLYYTRGRANPNGSFNEKSALSGILSRADELAAWQEGRTEARQSIKEKAAAEAEAKKRSEANQKKSEAKIIIDDDVSALSDSAKAIAGIITDNYGVNVRFSDTVFNGDAAVNGMYDPKQNAIIVSAKQADTKHIVEGSLLHELTHVFENLAPAEYKAMKQHVISTWKSNHSESFNHAVSKKISQYAKQDIDINESEAVDELMAEWSVNLLSDDKALLQFANYDQSLAEKIVNALKELLDRFLGYLKNTFGAKTAAYLEVSGMRDTFNSMWLQVSEAAKESTAGSISVIRYAAKDEESVHIKQAILDHLDELNTMEPVADISVPTDLSTKSKSTQYSIIEKYLKKYGKFIDRNNFGKIEINKDLISSSIGYLKTDEEYASIIASPLVLKRGIIIEDRVKRAGRDYYTLIIGAPVILNGTRGNIGIALKITKGYRFKMLRILTPNGTLFIFNKKTEDAFSDISLDKGQGRPGTSANNNVSQSSDNIKKKLSLADKETVILPNMKIDVKRVFSKDAAVREQYKREREKYEKDFDDAINKIIDSDNFAIMQVGVEGGNTQYDEAVRK